MDNIHYPYDGSSADPKFVSIWSVIGENKSGSRIRPVKRVSRIEYQHSRGVRRDNIMMYSDCCRDGQ